MSREFTTLKDSAHGCGRKDSSWENSAGYMPFTQNTGAINCKKDFKVVNQCTWRLHYPTRGVLAVRISWRINISRKLAGAPPPDLI